MSRQSELFSSAPGQDEARDAPLAERMRPHSLDEFRGQRHLLGPGHLLRTLVDQGHLESLILWGPPGCGKTSLARLLAAHHAGPVAHFSAVLSGVRELRRIVDEARADMERDARATVLFVDEIHRFNKAQQDAFLPHVESGLIILLGATTENPSFEIIPPLLSRARVVVLEPLDGADVSAVIDVALADRERGLGRFGYELADEARRLLLRLAHGDVRVALGLLEAAALLATAAHSTTLDEDVIREAAQHAPVAHDKAGDAHYDLLSAFIKSMRGSDPDAAVYWLMRLLEAGEDPIAVARRMIVFAAEDVGLACPEALSIAVAARDAAHVVGLPEGRIPLASATIFLATCAKSNAAYQAMRAATEDVRTHGALPVPLHLRNAPTQLMRALGHAEGYEYAHDQPDTLVTHGHLPADIAEREYYHPTTHGWEAERAAYLEQARRRRRG